MYSSLFCYCKKRKRERERWVSVVCVYVLRSFRLIRVFSLLVYDFFFTSYLLNEYEYNINFFCNILMFESSLHFFFIYSAISFVFVPNIKIFHSDSISYIRMVNILVFRLMLLLFFFCVCVDVWCFLNVLFFRNCCHIFYSLWMYLCYVAIHDLFRFVGCCCCLCGVLHTRKCSDFIWVFVGFVFRTKKWYL